MKVALLAGGRGTRLAEETRVRPKPMVEIGGHPILWHIMRHFSGYGYRDFVIALGYRGAVIKRWALELALAEGDLKIATSEGTVERIGRDRQEWNLELIETGLHTNNGGRIRRLADRIGGERFLLAWGDGVSDVDVRQLVSFHESHGKCATVTVVRPPARFGHVTLNDDRIVAFEEKPATAEGWINGGIMVLEPRVFDYIEGDATEFEKEPMETLAKEGQMMAYRHTGFWQCMDTVHDHQRLEAMWERGDAPWATWEGATPCASW